MSKLIFKPEEFARGFGIDVTDINADYVNKKIDKWLSEQIEVYCNVDHDGQQHFIHAQNMGNTHTARLVGIQEIKKEKCVHNRPIRYTHDLNIARCPDCGIELKTEWKEVK